MTFQDLLSFLNTQWPCIVGVSIFVMPISWAILEYLYKNRLEEKSAEIRKLQEKINSILSEKQGQNDGPYSSTVEIVPYTSINWDNLIENAKSTILANGFALVNVIELNCRRLVRKIKENDNFFVEIFLGNPFSAEAAMRARDENDNYLAPQRIAQVAMRLEEARNELQKTGKEAHIICKYFSIYPTMAIVIIDDILYVYFYPYGTLGTDSPILIFRNYKQNELATFFIEHFESISKQSFPIPFDKLSSLLHLPAKNPRTIKQTRKI